MVKTHEHFYQVREVKHQQQQPRRDRRSCSHRHHHPTSSPTSKRSTHTSFKLTSLYNPVENSREALLANKNIDFLIANGSIYAVNVRMPEHTKCIRLSRLEAPLKPDHPFQEYIPPPRRHPTPYRRNLPEPETVSSVEKNISTDNDSINSGSDSNLTSREEAIALKLNNIIERMEANMIVNEETADLYAWVYHFLKVFLAFSLISAFRSHMIIRRQ